jgi:hypothetical protein
MYAKAALADDLQSIRDRHPGFMILRGDDDARKYDEATQASGSVEAGGI